MELKKVYAGKLNGKRCHEVENENYKCQWRHGDDYKKKGDFNNVCIKDKDTGFDIEFCIYSEEHITRTNEIIKTFGFKLTTVKPRWRANRDELYWFIGKDFSIGEAEEYNDAFDYRHHSLGNYFKTKEEAELKLDKIKQILLED